MNLWLDDERKPPSFANCGLHWTWVMTADAAIEQLKTGNVEFASLDHDLCFEHYKIVDERQNDGTPYDTSEFKEKTGAHVINWMEENDVWPEAGVRIHTMNNAGKKVMLTVVEKIYGRTFQYQYKGTHRV
jgi:hypothetical protein